MKLLGAIFLEQTQSRRLGVHIKKQSRRPQGGGEGAPLPCGPLGDPLTWIFLLYIHIYSRTSRSIHENTFPPSQPSFPVRYSLWAFFGILPQGDSITEGFYINTIALPMKRE